MIMTNVNGIRTGLLSTFAGVIGVIGGVLFVLPLGPPQLLVFFWLVSVGLICLDRWPGDRGPAWATARRSNGPPPWRSAAWPPAPAARPRQRPGRQRAAEQEREIAMDEPVEQPARTAPPRKRKRKQGRKH